MSSDVVVIILARHRVVRPLVYLLQVFKARSDGALSSLVQWKVSLPMARGIGTG